MVVDVKSCDHTTVMYRVEKLRTLISKRLYACVCQTIPPRPSTGAPGLRNDCQQRRYGIFQPVSPLFALHTHCSVRASAISAEIALATDGSYLLFALSVRGSITLSSSHRSFFDLPSSFIDDFSTSKPRTRTECEPGPKHTAGATSPGMPSTVIEAFNCPGLPITSIVISRSCRLTVRLTRELLPTGLCGEREGVACGPRGDGGGKATAPQDEGGVVALVLDVSRREVERHRVVRLGEGRSPRLAEEVAADDAELRLALELVELEGDCRDVLRQPAGEQLHSPAVLRRATAHGIVVGEDNVRAELFGGPEHVGASRSREGSGRRAERGVGG
mmetsp:Transcript_23054/g.52788  ORF Transcript_23054/g.52788 Transcript_23054/m.52788 type:complete len:331 (-) Transcript_23054:17-1009(-)